ncbi:class C beta-lactamase-related serine hydrolase [Flavobacteriaceae bacterium AU392]|nr:class C beta-lactamase-related serine hydrolase [Flavobacteriaceae bacterium]RKM84828.1 class C beta-lactamase-related serine hydrolase [Flavobacteriaceae bacterium AU392]
MMRFIQILIILFCLLQLSYGQEAKNGIKNSEKTISIQPADLWLNLESKIDSLFQESMTKKEGIQGGIISIVSSDSILLKKGYGLANVQNNQLFDVQKTNVFVASVSKLITVTAAFQLIEQGKIDINQPVKELIGDIKIENPFDQRVLVRHILTHTAGFDDSSIGSEASSKENLNSLKKHLKKRLPPIVWEPGKYFNYSNHGMALLALIIETVSGISFNAYLQKNLFDPLKMTNSGFNLKEEMVNNLMNRYKWKEDGNNQLYLDGSYGIKYTNQIGAGGLITTANDMSNFMQMYLNQGVINGTQILKPETIKDMLTPHFQYHKLMDRKQGWVWRVMSANGLTYNYHAGDDTGIESILMMIPEKDLAFFFASNNNVANNLKWQIRDYILDVLNKNQEQVKSPPKDFVSTNDLKDLSGTYQYTNDGQSSIDRLTYLFGDVYKVTIEGRTLLINGKKYKETDNFLFKRETDDFLITFVVDENDTYYSTGYATYKKLKWYEVPSIHFILLITSFIILLTAIIGWIIQYIRRKKDYNKSEFKTKLIIGIAGFCLLIFFILLAATTQGITLKYGVPLTFWIYFTFPLIGFIVFLFGLYRIPRFFKNKSISLLGKTHFTLVIIAMITCLILYNYYNLIGYQF